MGGIVRGGPFSRQPKWAGPASRRSLFFMLSALAASSLGGWGCEHDPTILETHDLDLRGATSAEVRSMYLTMSDGVRIAVEVAVPNDHPSGVQLPTIIELTRYWRRREPELPYAVHRALQRGFVWIAIDERGTGASFGAWSAPLTDRALQDGREIIDWIVSQPWSNGRVGATGVSYPGMASQQLAAYGHPALRAIVPMSDTFDQYEDLLLPGGVFNEAFMQGWSDVVYAMDRNASITIEGETLNQIPVDEDPDGLLLEEAIAGHAGNLDVYEAVETAVARDDQILPGRTLDDLSTHTVASRLEESGVAVYHWGSWLDGGSADGAIRAFMGSSGPRRGTLGAWTHDLSSNSSRIDGGPLVAIPNFYAQWEEALNFFDDILRKHKPLQDRIFRYFTMGEGLWKATSTWPVPGTVEEIWYLGGSGSLSTDPPTGETGQDRYEVDFSAGSAEEPRWLGPLFAHTWYPDRGARDLGLLVYESPPLNEDMEVTGYPVVNLHLSSTHDDGAFFVYLEDVSPDGVVTYVTEGILRGIHRKVSEDPSSWKRPAPYHSFLTADIQPMVPGEVTELAIGMEPTSFLFRQGHRIRIAIAGHDAATFRRIPAQGTPVLKVQRNSAYPSSITLPVIR